MMLDFDTISLAQKLIREESVSPYDGKCQQILSDFLKPLGFNAEAMPFGLVKNLWATRAGRAGPLLVFAGHTDVVPPGSDNDWRLPPYSGEIEGNTLHGRGAADMKGSIAAMLTATARFVSEQPNYKGTIGFLITSDEEDVATDGTVRVMNELKRRGIKIDYCVIGEPSSTNRVGDVIRVGRRGSLNGCLKIRGIQGHVAYPEKARNPILEFAPALAELSKEIWDEGNDFFPATSFQIVKRIFNAVKAGHTGSLDPLATGLLPLCFGEATKFSQFLLDADKRYLARVKLGVITDSGDADGKIIERRPVPVIRDEEIENALSLYRGEILQIPSMFSAIKVDGQPLYKLARKGIEVERKGRLISVFDLKVLERAMHDEFSIGVHCSKGTYVRTLVEDLGEELGCGAHVSMLRRVSAGPFFETEAISMRQLEVAKENQGELDGFLLPVSAAVKQWPAVQLTDLTASYLRHGQAVRVSNAPTNGWVGIFSESVKNGDSFIGVGEILGDGRVAPRRLVAS